VHFIWDEPCRGGWDVIRGDDVICQTKGGGSRDKVGEGLNIVLEARIISTCIQKVITPSIITLKMKQTSQYEPKVPQIFPLVDQD